jgi:precorrin-6B methylase 1
MSDLVGAEEVRDVCENCETSPHCSQLRLALAILGESLTDSPSIPTAQRYQEILRLLAEAGWNYPQSVRLCQLSSRSEMVRALTDELIQLAKKKPVEKSHLRA